MPFARGQTLPSESTTDTTRFICLTPCRDESWVIGTHLQAASQWADSIVVGDQKSTDGTREIVRQFDKALLADNAADGYDEGERHRVVFDSARKLYHGEKKILLAIDSDELLSANWRTSPEWDAIKKLPPGSGIYAKWVNVNPDFRTWFPLGGHFIIGVVDDGKISHSPGQFHVPRLQQDPTKPKLFLDDIRLIHLQYTDPQRSASKNNAYQLQEWLVNPRRPVRLFRRFNATLTVRPGTAQNIRPQWIDGFGVEGVDWKAIRIDKSYRWDRLVVEAILKQGEAFFRRLDIWDTDWNAIADFHGIDRHRHEISDPRSWLEKRIHRFLRTTQPAMGNPGVRTIQLLLRCMGW